MRKMVLIILGTTLIAATTVQVAAASEHHARRARAPASGQFRNSKAYAAPAIIAVQPDRAPVHDTYTPGYGAFGQGM
jgi:hypothetical protein